MCIEFKKASVCHVYSITLFLCKKFLVVKNFECAL